MNLAFVALALIVLFYTNFMTHTLCQQKQMAEQHSSRVFRWINVCITILLISSYVEVIFH
ncbi:hypothetical protein [Ectobacillus ponti]|uniref:Uncharacterized protein n=1 Tax=Ectobacillus ponti TaxID=2961894 RepID=A0AA41X3W2_9BACI|nr:hypothetical protein [Ectobacillus ponti]MCP8968207.1 hypothetical protein [Ectobacillus ponti]